ncbi:MAG TPA: permease-like cell division protein FtsX [Candidatus Saccharimonadales bacterium]|nr:permease-like cell division protein FtsX [Candidatus Saccharimonadales bacterium]
MSRWERLKRWLVTLRRIIRGGCINFVRNSSLSIAAIAVMVITLTIVLSSIIANATFTNTVSQITDKINVSIFLNDSVTKVQADKLTEDLKKLPNVESVEYLSKEQVLENFKKQNSEDAEQLAAISATDKPLPATIHIKPRDTNKIGEIKTYLDKPSITALQKYPTSYSGNTKIAVDNITHAADFLQRAGLAGVLVFAVISMLIIFNTIQMAIFNRRDEITIMRLLGASTSYIRGPFVVESMIYGIFSAVISIVLLNALFIVSSSTLQASSLGLLDINYANQYFGKYFWLFLTLQLGIGIFIGTVSSVVATRRYLKFKTTK